MQTRNVDLSQRLGELPLNVEPVLRRISSLPQLTNAEEPSVPLDQLTVCLDVYWCPFLHSQGAKDAHSYFLHGYPRCRLGLT